jgi:hypothetical protein
MKHNDLHQFVQGIGAGRMRAKPFEPETMNRVPGHRRTPETAAPVSRRTQPKEKGHT